MTTEKVDINDIMDDDDYAIVIKSSGELKALFIPETASDTDIIPDTIVEMMMSVFGFDPRDEDDSIIPWNNTIH